MGRYNLTVSKNALSRVQIDNDFVSLMSNSDFGLIFGIGAAVYAISFLFNGPLVDHIGGKRGILIGAAGAALANLAMGLYLRYVLALPDPSQAPIVTVFSILYALNMYFQSYGAVSIVKVNANWFHVRERGSFSGIFGIMISSGIFFAFDGSKLILESGLVLNQGFGGGDAIWWVFFTPSFLLFTFFAIEAFLLKDRPAQAGLEDFDTADASSGEDMSANITTLGLYKRILTNPIILIIAGIEFCTGILRNGVMHWFPIYAKTKLNAVAEQLSLTPDQVTFLKENGWTKLVETLNLGAERSAEVLQQVQSWDWTLSEWGLILMIAGIIGGNVAGFVSDHLFQSRRAPSAGFLYGTLVFSAIVMIFSLQNGWLLSAITFLMSICVIGTHGLLSGTATMDFGGRRGAATAVGVIDGFVYLGTAVQSVSLGYITEHNWSYWPVFLIPFGVIGFLLLLWIWNAKPGSSSAH
jgi:OPA family glycerol-3-phosphate transporter-like MFS transporter